MAYIPGVNNKQIISSLQELLRLGLKEQFKGSMKDDSMLDFNEFIINGIIKFSHY